MKRLALFLTGLTGLTILTAGCGEESGKNVPQESRSPLILFAVDGMEWSILKPLLEAGKLPVMAALMKGGTFGYLESMTPTYSPVIWTTVATGKAPEKHGIRHFVFSDRSDGQEQVRYYTSGHRRTKAFWNILSDYGLAVHTLGWWMTYPAEPINGVMVSQTNTTGVLRNAKRALWKGTLLEGVEGQVHPPAMQNRIMTILREVENSLDGIIASIFGEPPHPLTDFSQLMWDQTRWAFRADAVYSRAAREILSKGEPLDLMAIYLGGPDVSGHRFWRYAYPDQFDHPPGQEQLDNFGEVIERYYTYTDRVIGEVLAAAPAGAEVMIVSDHGMHAINTDHVFSADDPPNKANSGHHPDGPPGVFIAAGPSMRPCAEPFSREAGLDLEQLKTVGRVLDVFPTILALKGIPLGKDLDGRVIKEVVAPERLARFPIRWIDSHDDAGWLESRDGRITDAVDQSARLEQLRELGYIR